MPHSEEILGLKDYEIKDIWREGKKISVKASGDIVMKGKKILQN